MPEIAHDVLRSPGQPLDPATRAFFEPRFGHDFSQVRVHRDTRATVLAQTMQTDAMKRGFSPESLQHEVENLKKRQFACPPVPDSVTNTAGVRGAGTLGWTKIDKSSNLICMARFDVDAKSRTCTVRPLPLNLSITSKFAKVEPQAPSGQTMQLPECGKKDVPIFTTITPEISKLLQAGEQEHCDDLNLAFKQTLEPCAAALTKFAGQKVAGGNQDECLKALIAKLGFDPLDCTEEFLTLSSKTDERDAKGWHDFDPVLISKSCDRIVVGNKKSATNKVGDPSVASNKQIPAATKCGTAAPAPTFPRGGVRGGGPQDTGANPRP